uniref:Uncharacterized protein n=1 Tax=Rhizophora mucronata TaxID=61149 RepID=A0A2P2PNZ1_RHIMU
MICIEHFTNHIMKFQSRASIRRTPQRSPSILMLMIVTEKWLNN